MPRSSASPCNTHYNALLLAAKRALSRGDRPAALSLLKQAKVTLDRCAELDQEDDFSPTALACNGWKEGPRFNR